MTLYTGHTAGRRLARGDFDVSRYPQIPTHAVLEYTWGWGHGMGSDSMVITAAWMPFESTAEEALRGRLSRTRTGLFEDGMLLPSVNTQSDAMHPMMTWWALLFALSILARYHLTAWVAALDPDQSPLAVPLQALLDVAPDAVAAYFGRPCHRGPRAPDVATTTWRRLSALKLVEHDRLVVERGDPFRRRTTM